MDWWVDIVSSQTLFVPVIDESGKEVMKGVSRSFYLSLRLLPAPMRGAASLGYLLARTSDTLADAASAPSEIRRNSLDRFRSEVVGDSEFNSWPAVLMDAIPDVRERHLLDHTAGILKWLQVLPENEAVLVREVLETIISGQVLDLERFAGATCENPVALPDDAALEDYAWRVAGCVGEFWTKLGFLTLGADFSKSPEAEMLEMGITYGKALQLVNILRDITQDLSVGRCYLPVIDPRDPLELLACHARWLIRAGTWVDEGERYANKLVLRRLRAASVLPALLARKTLEPLRDATWNDLQSRIKVPRSAVYRSLVRAFF